MKKTIAIAAAAALVGVALVARGVSGKVDGEAGAARAARAAGAAGAAGSRLVRLEGEAQRVGNGTARAYILVDERDASVPVEVGVALSEGVMEGLPKPAVMDHSKMTGDMEHVDAHNWILELPAKNPTRYQFVQFGWNPKGHEPPGVWDVPHFDFHFWTASKAVRASIVPSDPKFGEKAGKYPAEALRPPFYVDAATAAKATPAQMTVPEMGMHWIDVRTPEVQGMAGKPEAYRPFTTTYIYGTWDGEFIFAEPMITREYLMAKRDTAIQVPAAKFPKPGYYATEYRIRWEPAKKEYVVALGKFERKEGN